MKIQNEIEFNRFKEHLDLPNNKNVVFSGIFGIGKTYFLREFFERNIEEYEKVWLSPVHYSVAANEDIINCIKYDLVFELLHKDNYLVKEEFTKDLTTRFYLRENFSHTIALLAQNAGSIGKSISGVFTNLKKIRENIETYHAEHQINEEDELMQFLIDINNRSGSIFEENRITELIRVIVSSISNTGKKTILVIDDLDRLDPDHIFRILNVFACHMDFAQTDNNKFGFQKIILVCDIENIRNVFKHRYGLDADFNGYLEKFFSHEIFEFKNKNSLTLVLANFIQSLEFSGSINCKEEFANRGGSLRNLFSAILQLLIEFDILSTRSLSRMFGSKLFLFNYSMRITSSHSLYTNNFDVTIVFEILIKLFGSDRNVLEVLSKLSRKLNPILFKDILGMNGNALVAFLDVQNYNGKKSSELFEYSYQNLIIRYSVLINGYSDQFKVRIESCQEGKIENKDFPVRSITSRMLQNVLSHSERWHTVNTTDIITHYNSLLITLAIMNIQLTDEEKIKVLNGDDLYGIT